MPLDKSYTLHSREGCYSVDWLGNAPDLHYSDQSEEARNNMKENLVNLQKGFGLIFAITVLYSWRKCYETVRLNVFKVGSLV